MTYNVYYNHIFRWSCWFQLNIKICKNLFQLRLETLLLRDILMTDPCLWLSLLHKLCLLSSVCLNEVSLKKKGKKATLTCRCVSLLSLLTPLQRRCLWCECILKKKKDLKMSWHPCLVKGPHNSVSVKLRVGGCAEFRHSSCSRPRSQQPVKRFAKPCYIGIASKPQVNGWNLI